MNTVYMDHEKLNSFMKRLSYINEDLNKNKNFHIQVTQEIIPSVSNLTLINFSKRQAYTKNKLEQYINDLVYYGTPHQGGREG